MTHSPDGGDLLRWWHQHSELDRLVDALVDALERGEAQPARAACEELTEAMRVHLREEEHVAFPIIERFSPEHAEGVHRAREAHHRLRGDLDAIGSRLERGELEPARRALAALLDLFRSHEDAETRLVAGLHERSAAAASG